MHLYGAEAAVRACREISNSITGIGLFCRHAVLAVNAWATAWPQLARRVAAWRPAILARGLRRVVLEMGVTIHEGTKVIRLNAGPEAVTDRGTTRRPA